MNRGFWRLTSRASQIHRRPTKCEESFGGETVTQSLPEENLDFLGARGGPYLVPMGFIRRDQLMLEKKCCSGLDGAYTLIVGPEKGVFECSNTGYRNTLDQLLDFFGGGGGEGD